MISVPLKPAGWDQETAIILAHGAGQGMQSPFMTFFHETLAARGFLSVIFNFEYMEQKKDVPDPQPKLSHYSWSETSTTMPRLIDRHWTILETIRWGPSLIAH